MAKFRKVNVHDIMRTLDTLERAEVRVGWFGSRDKSGTYNAYKASENEFGNPAKRIPPRPFIFNFQNKDVANGLRKALKIAQPASAKDALKKLGKAGVKAIRKGIDSVWEPQLSEMAIVRRSERGNESLKPLIDTGSMRRNVKSVIVEGGADA